MSPEVHKHQKISANAQPFRVDVRLHDLLKKPEVTPPLVLPAPSAQLQRLPEPVFPQRAELLTDNALPQDRHGSPDDPYKRHWTASQVLHTMRGWMVPYWLNSNKGTKCGIGIRAARTFLGEFKAVVSESVDPSSIFGSPTFPRMIARNHCRESSRLESAHA